MPEKLEQENSLDAQSGARRRYFSFWDRETIVPSALPEEKRREVEEAILAGRVRDPISMLVSIGISLAVSGASMLAARIFGPKQAPTRQGELHGEVSGLMSSSAGQLIPEIYGGDPGDGKGGVKIPAFIFWASKLRKTVTESRQSTGGGKGFGSHQTQTVQNVSYDLDFAAMGPRGPAVLKREWGNTDKIIDLDTRGYYEGEDSSNTFTAPYQISSYSAASGGQDVTLQASGGGTASVQFNAVVSNGATTRDLTIYYVTGATFTAEVSINGTPQTVNFPNTSNAYGSIVLSSVSLNNGNNTIKIRNTNASFNLRIDRIFCFPGFSDTTRATGILNPTYPVDPVYDPTLPPDPTLGFTNPRDRHNFAPTRDAYGVTTGQTLQGQYANYAIYPGNTLQLQDPTIQADVDGRLGTNSTPAYRNRAYIRHSGFKLDRWQGVMPNITQLWEHESIKKLSQVFSQWCDRVGMASTDYDFSAVSSISVRGLLVSGRLYQPSEVMRYCEDVYDVFVTETDGQVQAVSNASAPTITIPESEIGWTEDDSGSSNSGSIDTFVQLTSQLVNEATLPRRVDVRFIDPDKEYEQNTSAATRADTEGQTSLILDLAFTMTAAEAATLATRRVFRDYLRGTTHRFTLSWKYLYLYPGYIINTTRNGIPIAVQVTSIKGGIGVLECEGWTADTATSTQSVTTSGGQGGVFPNVGVISSAVCALMDTPLLRDGDETTNNGVGMYVAATPRTTTGQVWVGASLYINKVGWERIADFKLPATMGRQVLANGSSVALPSVSDATIWDNTNSFTVDLYGATATLTSATQTDVLNGANACILGGEVIQFTTATRVGGYTNRWTLSGLLRGRRGTEYAISTHTLNENFVLLNEAVQFVAMNIADMNRAFQYKMVTAGQAIADAATIGDGTTTQVWTGRSLQPLAVSNIQGTRDSAGSLLVEFQGRTRLAGGVRSYQAGALNEEVEEYRVQILNAGSTILPNGKTRILPVLVGTAQAALLISDASPTSSFTYIQKNSLVIPSNAPLSANFNAAAAQRIDAPGNFAEATLHVDTFSGGVVTMGVISATDLWKNVTPGFGLSIQLSDNLTGNLNLNIFDNGTPKYSALNVGNDLRFRITLTGTELRVYLNWQSLGSVPLYISSKAPIFPLRFVATVSNGSSPSNASVKNIILTTFPFPKTIYSADQQTEDFGSAQSSIQMDIWQVSRLGGDGQKTRVTL